MIVLVCLSKQATKTTNEDYPDWKTAYFGSNYGPDGVFNNLLEVKNKLDPNNKFKYPHGIPPLVLAGYAQKPAHATKVFGERVGRTIHDYQNGKADKENYIRSVPFATKQ